MNNTKCRIIVWGLKNTSIILKLKASEIDAVLRPAASSFSRFIINFSCNASAEENAWRITYLESETLQVHMYFPKVLAAEWKDGKRASQPGHETEKYRLSVVPQVRQDQLKCFRFEIYEGAKNWGKKLLNWQVYR